MQKKPVLALRAPVRHGASRDALSPAVASAVSVALLALCLVVSAMLSYEWSFGETTFGGLLGFVLPPMCCLLSWIAGVCLNIPRGVRQ